VSLSSLLVIHEQTGVLAVSAKQIIAVSITPQS
jgi:hypothetical protein